MPEISEYGDIEEKYNMPELSDENYNLLGEIIYSVDHRKIKIEE